ncbi:alcohol dehydrogenase catalytic domain-containing protein [Modestobacter sp. I12A-02628]|uniref:Glutathione-dependent formaldehyde dehydrogenase n=1 Tax=Goekera deserti TaxID=2497753 RepID=A0A7K3WBK9_9ACTN|nr:zinc-dependent alcohol dehydrogenase [Goekera deserti]MPQ98276.1 alcohol dehydrogenase catalytic domain-containing protein [Goekera deserti]NDI48102.1 alcohol dehydrogenase catalytic domain-containing protein [Goekera deserti]NEL53851.1 glutathione-dependent formaldehyde dehydrogenase [Goekera deserti]
MKALTWTGINEVSVEDVAEPQLLNDHDVILKIRQTVTCGSDLHLIGGYVPFMRAGDVLGHEFMGEVVEVGKAVTRRKVGDRVVVPSFIGCGSCWYCKKELYSLCDNGNPNPGITEGLWGQSPGGCFGYSHAMGGYAGSHAEYMRVPYADVGAFLVPDGVSDTRALFASDSVTTGWTGADLGGVQPGDTVAVWGAGAVGQMAARSAMLLGAEQVVVIDRIPERLQQVRQFIGADTIDYTAVEVTAELRERTGGRGPDVCIEAVGMEAHSPGPAGVYDQVKQQLRLQTDRPTAVREAIRACRKGGSVFVLGVFAGMVDKFPLGAMMNKGLTVRGAQQHGQRYLPRILDHMQKGELVTEHLATHTMPLIDGPRGYEMFKAKTDGCVRAVFTP